MTKSQKIMAPDIITEEFIDGFYQYVRKDIVDEMVDALDTILLICNAFEANPSFLNLSVLGNVAKSAIAKVRRES